MNPTQQSAETKTGHLVKIRKTKRLNGNTYWLCLCDCGKEKEFRSSNIGRTKSCGCKRDELLRIARTVHGLTYTKFWYIWSGMKGRCNNKKNKDWKRYGGRGITVSEEWKSFLCFRDDMFETYKNHCKVHGESNTTIERLDNNSGYSKKNCIWATRATQANNKASARLVTSKGETRTLIDWSRITGIKYTTLYNRIYIQGVPVERALTTAVKE